MICFQLSSETTLVFTLKNLLKNPVFDKYTKVGVRKYEIPVSKLQEVVNICDTKQWEVVPFPKETQIALDWRISKPFNKKFKKTGVWKLMFPYQKEGVKRAIKEFDGRCLIGDEMGLGKTLQAIAIYKYYRGTDSLERLLVVCPAYLRRNWAEEFKKWMPFLDPVLIEKGSDDVNDGWPLIISYDLAARMVDKLLVQKVEMVICDESHYLKSHTTKRTKALTKLVKGVKRILFLTGTPALNRPCELYSQAHMLYPKVFPKWRQFAVRYCKGEISPFGFFDASGTSNEFELKWICRKMFMIRRKKDTVLTDLPEKIRCEIHVDCAKKDVAPLQGPLQKWKELNKEIKFMETNNPCSDEIRKANFERKCLISELFRLTSMAKADVVCKVVADMAATGVPFLVFCYHKELMTKIEDQLYRTLGGNYFRIDGDTPTPKRQEFVNAFQNGEYQVAILSLLAASTGITLTRSNIILFAEMYWVPGTMLQAEDRIHRIGQKNACDIKYLIAGGTLDSYLFQKLNRKLATVDTILDGVSNRSLSGERLHYSPLLGKK